MLWWPGLPLHEAFLFLLGCILSLPSRERHHSRGCLLNPGRARILWLVFLQPRHGVLVPAVTHAHEQLFTGPCPNGFARTSSLRGIPTRYFRECVGCPTGATSKPVGILTAVPIGGPRLWVSTSCSSLWKGWRHTPAAFCVAPCCGVTPSRQLGPVFLRISATKLSQLLTALLVSLRHGYTARSLGGLCQHWVCLGHTLLSDHWHQRRTQGSSASLQLTMAGYWVKLKGLAPSPLRASVLRIISERGSVSYLPPNPTLNTKMGVADEKQSETVDYQHRASRHAPRFMYMISF